MKVRQVSVFLENRSGRLAKITTALGNAGINIRAMSLADTSDFGILRMVMTNTEKAVALLKEHGFTVRVTEVLAVSIPDMPGALGNLLSIMENTGLNLEYVYVFIQKSPDEAVLIFRFDDPDRALKTLLENGINVLDENAVLGI
ncbi:MAG: ACT domain-containing protein [Thermodesulfobacteriota bacterium]